MTNKQIDYANIAKKLFKAGYQVGQYGEHVEISKGGRVGYVDSTGLHLMYPWTSEAENIRSILGEIQQPNKCPDCGKPLTEKQMATGIHWCNPQGKSKPPTEPNWQVYVKLGCYVFSEEEARAIIKTCREAMPYIDYDDCDIINEKTGYAINPNEEENG